MFTETSRLLIDAGLSARELEKRLEQAGVQPAALQGICLSHEHDDHTKGLKIFCKKHGVPVYGNGGTLDALRANPELAHITWKMFTTGSPFQIGDITLEPFSVSHDAFEPVGFVLASGAARLGVATDIGIPTELVRQRLRPCLSIILEANHDELLLMNAQRPWALKQRILGRQGHLSNQTAAALLAEIAGPHLTRVVLAHLSRDCNRGELAKTAVQRALEKRGITHVEIHVAAPDTISSVWKCG